MKVRKFNLGFFKVEKHVDNSLVMPSKGFISIETKKSEQPKKPDGFIKIERVKQDSDEYKAIPESTINIKILPKQVYEIIKNKEIKKFPSYKFLCGLFKKEEVGEKKREKPKLFARIMKEIKELFTNLILFDTSITALILFLIGYLVTMILALNKFYSLIAPLIYILVYLFLRFRENMYIAVERKYPNLNEKLRTAVDNVYAENEILNELRNEIYADIRQVDYATFFKEKRTSYKIFLIVLLCFGIIFMAQYNVEFKINFDRALGFVQGGNGNTTGIISDIITATTKGTDDDIYAEEQLAKLGKEKLTIQINKVGYEINVNDIKEPTKQDFEESLFPEEIGLEKAEVYNKNILKEDQDLVKNYFKNLAKEK